MGFTILLTGESSIEERHIERSFPQFAYGSYKLQQYMKNNAKMFFDAEKWERYITEQHFTFCFGSRFHGNMAALRSGVPALWITHDSRTAELVQALNLPHIDYHIFSKIKKVEELLEFCDYSNFISNYPILYKNYRSYLDENNIQTNI